MKRPLVRGRNTAGMSVSDLATMSRAELLDAWARVVRRPAVRGASRELLVHTIAWHLQAQQHGGLPVSVQRRLERLAAAIDRGEPVRLVSATDRMRTGTTLEREWRGETHVVAVTADAFLYRGKRHRSLSEIARLITGTRWNGPAFFGLRSGKNKAPASSDDAN